VDSAAFLDHLMATNTLLLARAAVSVATALARRAPRYVMVGQSHALQLTEAFMDLGLGSPQFFAGDAADRFHPSRPLLELQPEDVELVFVGDRDPSRAGHLAETCRRSFAHLAPHSRPLVIELDALAAVFAIALKLIEGTLESCLNPHKLALLAVTLHLTPPDGCVVEAGVAYGGTTVFLAKMQTLLGLARPIYALDTFEGMPEPVAQDHGGNFVYTSDFFKDSTLPRVQRKYAACRVSDQIRVRKGLVQDTLSAVLKEAPSLSLMLLDTDQYSGTTGGLSRGVPALLPGGMIIVDDSTATGVDRAIREQLGANPQLRRGRISENFELIWSTS